MKKSIFYFLLVFSIGKIYSQEVASASLAAIEIKGESAIHLNDKKVTMEELKEALIDHYREYKSESATSLTLNGETRMSIVADLKNLFKKVLLFLRNELAQKKFKTSYPKLTADQREVIKNIYPVKMTRSRLRTD